MILYKLDCYINCALAAMLRWKKMLYKLSRLFWHPVEGVFGVNSFNWNITVRPVKLWHRKLRNLIKEYAKQMVLLLAWKLTC